MENKVNIDSDNITSYSFITEGSITNIDGDGYYILACLEENEYVFISLVNGNCWHSIEASIEELITKTNENLTTPLVFLVPGMEISIIIA